MRSRHRLTQFIATAFLVLALVTGISAVSAGESTSVGSRHTSSLPAPGPSSSDLTPIALGAVVTASQYVQVQIEAYATEFNYQQLVTWVAAHQPQVTISNGRFPRSSARSAPSGGGGGVGECTGFVIPDYIIQRESGGILHKWNTQGSGAFGCAQTLITHYSAGGTCAGDDPNTIEGQRDCVNRLSNGGRNLNPWSETR